LVEISHVVWCSIMLFGTVVMWVGAVVMWVGPVVMWVGAVVMWVGAAVTRFDAEKDSERRSTSFG